MARRAVTTADGGQASPPVISVVIPVHNGVGKLERCLKALRQSEGPGWEAIVVDDGSTDRSAELARAAGARVVSTGPVPVGPAQARNLGALSTSAPLLCFVDADVLVRPDTLGQFNILFESDPGLVAAFGSYDTRPAEHGLLSQYRNLLHHFVHQGGREAASTFWSGCGAIRRSSFLAIGGFDPAYARPSIEDIELGYRLRAAGARIRLAKHIQVTHLKRWTLWDIVQSDVRDRALPWTALIARTRCLPDDLNLDWASRASALSVYALLGLTALGWSKPHARLAAALPVALLLTCNRRLYAFFLRQRGPWFLVRVLPVHWLYYGYSALAFGGGLLAASLRGGNRRPRAEVPPIRLVRPFTSCDSHHQP
jgi:glycosyltransferase involved in cell wall biosynthesis